MLKRRGVRTPANSLNRGSGGIFRCAVGCHKHLGDMRRFRGVIIHTRRSNSILHLGSITGIRLKALDCNFSDRVSNGPTIAFVVCRMTNSGTARIGRHVTTRLRGVGRRLPANVRFVAVVDSGSFLFTSVCGMIRALVITVVLMVLIICFFLRSFGDALVPSVSVVISLVNAFTYLATTKFAVGVLALFTLILTVNAMISSTVMIMRTMRTGFSTNCASSCRTAGSTVNSIAVTIVSYAYIFVTIFVPMAFVNNASNVFCARFNIAVTASMNLSVVYTLALYPTLYTVVVHPDSKGGDTGDFGKHMHTTCGTSFGTILNGCGGNIVFFVRRH